MSGDTWTISFGSTVVSRVTHVTPEEFDAAVQLAELAAGINVDAPEFEAPFTLTAQHAKRPTLTQGNIFKDQQS